MPLKKDLAEFSMIVQAGAAALRNVVNEPELSAWLEEIASERLGPAGPAPQGAEPTRGSKAREWLAKVARKHQLREGLSTEVGPGEASASSWGGLPWVRKAMAEHRTLSRLVLPHEERERIAAVLDWMRSDEGPPASGDWTRISLEQAVKSEHDWIESKAKAFAKKKQGQEAGRGTKLFMDLSSLGAKWEGWRWVRVESSADLDREGALMKHCVGSYAKDVAEGRKEIYSLRDPQDKPKLTVEACGSTLSQLKGCANEACPSKLREAAGAFAWAFEKAVDPDGLGLVELSEDVAKAGFASLPGVGVFQRESGLLPDQRARWARRLSDLAKGKGKGTHAEGAECENFVFLLAKMGMAQELSELLPLVDPRAKHSQALSEASREGHKAIVEMLLPGSDPKTNSSLALREAASRGHKEIVAILLSRSDPLAGNSGALRLAARAGYKEIVELLLLGSDPLAWDSEALRGAARGGHKEIVEMLLPRSDPKARDSEALRGAAEGGHKDIVERLLPWSDPLAGESGALRLAARAGYKEIVELLLLGSDPKAEDSWALRWAADRGHKEIVDMLLPLSDPLAADSGALRWAARAGHKEIVELLLPLSDPKARDSEALRLASEGGHKDIVERLLPGSDPLAGESGALRMAARNGHKGIVEMLLPLSDPLAMASEALRWAAGSGHKEIVVMLLPLSDPLARDSHALYEAAGSGHKEIVQVLAHCYRGDEKTFNSILKKAGMNSSDFNVSISGETARVEPLSERVVEKVVERRRKILSWELAPELLGRVQGLN